MSNRKDSQLISFLSLLAAASLGAGCITGSPGLAAAVGSSDDRGDDVAAPSSAPRIPDPNPPAYRDADGIVHGPGGPISSEPRECGPAQNHCLRGNAWFATNYEDSAAGDIHTLMMPVFEFEGRWYSWEGKPAEGMVERTTSANADEGLHPKGHRVYVFVSPSKETPWPASEAEALTSPRWDALAPYTVDAAAGTFSAEGFDYPISAARIPYDRQSAN